MASSNQRSGIRYIWEESIIDDRRTCAQCQNFQPKTVKGKQKGRPEKQPSYECVVAIPGGLVSASRGYSPDPQRLHRCAGYSPNPDELDERPGAERWPFLFDCR